MRAGGPAGIRRTIQWLVIVTLLAWATQTLVSQWGYGAEVAGGDVAVVSVEKFVPAEGMLRCATVELRLQASIQGSDIKLRQIARWSERDDLTMRPAADLVIARFASGQMQQSVDLEQVKSTLEAAGVNVAAINFSGAAACRVTRSDARLASAVEQAATAMAARIAAPSRPGRSASTVLPLAPVIPPTDGPTDPADLGSRSLREILLAELSERFALPAESFQVRFRPQDEKLVNLREPLFRFDVEPRRQRNIGDITWDVTIVTDAGRQRAAISADVRVWQTRVVAVAPIAHKQIFREGDLEERRVLVDRLADGPVLTKAQVVGQQAARDINPSTPLTGPMIEAVQCVRSGELITVTVALGRVQVNWVAEARESGASGQTILVRKPGSPREEFKVLVTGPQQGRLIGPNSSNTGATRLASAP